MSNLIDVMNKETSKTVDKKTKLFIKAGSTFAGATFGAVLIPAAVFGAGAAAAIGTLAFVAGPVIGAAGGYAAGKSVSNKLIKGSTENKQLDEKKQKSLTDKED